MGEIWQLPARRLAELIRTRQITAAAVLDEFLARGEVLNGTVNALATKDIDAAVRQAGRVDARLAAGERPGPLAGVPITVKDTLETKDLRSTAGFLPLADHVPDRDAVSVGRLRAAGAVVFAKSNVSTLAGDAQTENAIFGVTSNPWDTARTSGGSSGGGAAAVAAGLTPLDLGSDLAGSLRAPAHFCGICTLKPTEHAVPLTGHIPPLPGTAPTARHMSSIGPMATNPGDLRLAFDLLHGPDGTDMDVPHADFGDGTRFAGPEKLSICWTDGFAGLPVTADTGRVLAGLAQRLADNGARVDRVDHDAVDWDLTMQMWAALLHVEVSALLTADQEQERIDKWGATVDSPVAFLRGMAQARAASSKTHSEILRTRDRLIRDVDRLLTDHDAFLCPVGVGPAFPHCPSNTPIDVDGRQVPYLPATIGYTAPFNLTGHPAVVLPAGLSAGGLPIGVQIVGRRWRDVELLALSAVVHDVADFKEVSPVALTPLG